MGEKWKGKWKIEKNTILPHNFDVKWRFEVPMDMNSLVRNLTGDGLRDSFRAHQPKILCTVLLLPSYSHNLIN